jgi:hypothetical protein
MTTNDPPDTSIEQGDEAHSPNERLVYCEITGHLVVARQPGAPLVTDEEVRRMLEDFP